MFSLSQLNQMQIIVFGLIMVRMIAFVFSAAILSSPIVPVASKILLSLVLTMMVYNGVATKEIIVRVSEAESQIILLAFLEIFIGLCLGFLTRLFFFAVSMAGEMISVSLGLGQAQMFNPMMGHSGNALEQFLVMFATLVFFVLGGHHFLIEGLVSSFSHISLGFFSMNKNEFRDIVLTMQQVFVVAIKLSAPIVVSLLVIQISVGLLSKAVPQINVLSTTAAITALVGFILLIVCLPLMTSQMGVMLEEATFTFFKFMKGI